MRNFPTGSEQYENTLKGAFRMEKESRKCNDMERYWLWLCSCPGLYRTQIAGLVRFFGDPRSLYEAPSRELERWKKLSDDATTKWINALIEYKETTGVAEAEGLLEKKGLHFVGRKSQAFPQKLIHLTDCPYGLFYRGKLPDPGKPSVAVVGARGCSEYGKQMASVLGKALAGEGYQVISGMAAGIDGIAQSTCISAGGSSFAVLGCGADVCYPQENRGLFDRLGENGGILSEYPSKTPPLRSHFPQRNRLISGLSDAVIVVEARARSGSLITADLALDQGKEVYAVPGRYNDLLSYGCNRLIEQGAGIVLSTDNLLENLASALDLKRICPRKDEKEGHIPDDLDEDEQKIYAALSSDARALDEIASETGLTLLQAMRALLGLQLRNMAIEVSKNRFTVKIA